MIEVGTVARGESMAVSKAWLQWSILEVFKPTQLLVSISVDANLITGKPSRKAQLVSQLLTPT